MDAEKLLNDAINKHVATMEVDAECPKCKCKFKAKFGKVICPDCQYQFELLPDISVQS